MTGTLKWHIGMEDRTAFHGSLHVKNGRITLRKELPKGKIEYISATLRVDLNPNGKIFMNGYQSWSKCKENTVISRVRGVRRIPRKIIDWFALDRYSDYHFNKYPYKPGVIHGYSYGYFREGAVYRLVASLDESNGYTIFSYDAGTAELLIKKDCKGVACEGETVLMDLFFAEGSEKKVFDQWFEALQIRPRTTQKIAGYSSWYNRYQDISEKSIYEDLLGAQSLLRAGDLFQIDDGWEPAVGDWLEPDGEKFPKGMKAAAQAIHESGFKAGLWLAPFVAEENSKLFQEKPDWFFIHNGERWKAGSNWSGFYSLDIDHPEVQNYLKNVFSQVIDEWGYDLLKLDFLYAAAPFGKEGETRAARMIRAMKMLREWCGEKLILACGVPLMPAFGIADYCRVSCDVTLDWNDKPHMRMIHMERPSTMNAILTDKARRQLNQRAFGNDPDVFFLRNNNIRLNEEQKERLYETCIRYGNVFLTSDNISNYSEEQKDLYRYLRDRFEGGEETNDNP